MTSARSALKVGGFLLACLRGSHNSSSSRAPDKCRKRFSASSRLARLHVVARAWLLGHGAWDSRSREREDEPIRARSERPSFGTTAEPQSWKAIPLLRKSRMSAVGFEAGHCECQLGARGRTPPPAVSLLWSRCCGSRCAEGTDTVRKRVEEIVRWTCDSQGPASSSRVRLRKVYSRLGRLRADRPRSALDAGGIRRLWALGRRSFPFAFPSTWALCSGRRHEPHCRRPSEHAQRGGGLRVWGSILSSSLHKCMSRVQMPGVDLPFTLIFDYPSVASIAAARLRWDPAGPLCVPSFTSEDHVMAWASGWAHTDAAFRSELEIAA